MNLVLLGAPGSGKGTQAVRLAQQANLKHISSGDLLREAVEKKTDVGRQAEEYIEAGKLVPDQLVLSLIMEALGALDDHAGWILDGYPRNADQAEALEDVLSTNREVIDAVVFLEVDADVVTQRLLGRGRQDDTEETIRSRLDVFNEETLPVLEFYELRYDVHRVDGSKPIEDVTETIIGLVDL